MSKINSLIEEMNKIKTSEYFYADFDDIVVNYDIQSITEEEFDMIFKFIEENPYIDYGGPGSLVHFIEYFYGLEYESSLKKSILRKPTCQTLLMLNRVINALEGNKKEEFINLYKLVLEMDIPKNVLDEALHYLNYQKDQI
ncbi:hypothetical protein R9X47_28565 [Wukongibacter baidiensis]|uniref:hypothetical protein n=1 Tax=Wukongibacter baidiensis TaxID=1723361 RepID=UPI003D7F7308